MDFTSYLPIIGALVGAAMLLNEVLTKLTHVNGTAARIQSWIVSIGLVFLSDFSDLTAVFAPLVWYIKLIVGLVIGLVANGIFDMNTIKLILETIKIRTHTPDNPVKPENK